MLATQQKLALPGIKASLTGTSGIATKIGASLNAAPAVDFCCVAML
jgi:hypothetical protein